MAARKYTWFDRLAESIGPVTAGTLVLVLAGTLIAPAITHWARFTNAFDWVAFIPDDIWAGQLWRLVTYPWVIVGRGTDFIINIVLSIWSIAVFMAAVEQVWGPRRTLFRLAILIIGPALLVSALYRVFPHIRGDIGPQNFISGMLVAYAVALRGNQVRMFFLPFAFSGDSLIMLEGAIIFVFIVTDGTILTHVLMLVSYFWAIAWFRLGLGLNIDFRKAWLRFRKARIEARMARMRKRSGLRIVSSRDEEDEPKRYLH
jgi:hypothetical protein